jgi:hypothetical protein
MARRLQIPQELMALNPTLNVHQIRDLIQVIWKAKNNRVRQAHIFKITLPNLGVMRSRGNKRPKNRRKALAKDRLRKRLKKIEKESGKNLTL